MAQPLQMPQPGAPDNQVEPTYIYIYIMYGIAITTTTTTIMHCTTITTSTTTRQPAQCIAQQVQSLQLPDNQHTI